MLKRLTQCRGGVMKTELPKTSPKSDGTTPLLDSPISEVEEGATATATASTGVKLTASDDEEFATLDSPTSAWR